ncbi:predicted protein [Sclerotinia sclerotiorum 1980 UF-70]|uniref:Uncharacterized protein n=1 Tax=Sclerotinia sclerotiorum (strain ATCC 18683 / 1980 / Ss-1) TaxID=665079 RepID=A7E5D6_SCLS1|nr:predicted protein [Sclerotinia sclerotiorum 1980 UF-70]EDN91108.1 predicted protein [Sclerotinia sclerotiorum 1980 UF-70]
MRSRKLELEVKWIESEVVTVIKLGSSWASGFVKIEEIPVIEKPKLELAPAMIIVVEMYADGEEEESKLNWASKTPDMSTE